MIFTSPLSDGEIEKVEGYLAHKWGLDGDLPNDHSYKTGIDDTYSFGVPYMCSRISQVRAMMQNKTPMLANQNLLKMLGTSGDMPILRFDGSDDFLNLKKLIRSEPFLWCESEPW